jgi:hypothetical protein
MDGDNVAVFDAEIVSNHTVYPRRAVIKIIISQNDENSVLPLLALD